MELHPCQLGGVIETKFTQLQKMCICFSRWAWARTLDSGWLFVGVFLEVARFLLCDWWGIFYQHHGCPRIWGLDGRWKLKKSLHSVSLPIANMDLMCWGWCDFRFFPCGKAHPLGLVNNLCRNLRKDFIWLIFEVCSSSFSILLEASKQMHKESVKIQG